MRRSPRPIFIKDECSFSRSNVAKTVTRNCERAIESIERRAESYSVGLAKQGHTRANHDTKWKVVRQKDPVLVENDLSTRLRKKLNTCAPRCVPSMGATHDSCLPPVVPAKP